MNVGSRRKPVKLKCVEEVGYVNVDSRRKIWVHQQGDGLGAIAHSEDQQQVIPTLRRLQLEDAQKKQTGGT